MHREAILLTLRDHRAELLQLGVASISLFGSAARGDAHPGYIDLAVRLRDDFSAGGFEYFGKLATLESRLSAMLQGPVDVVEEPVRRPVLQQAIDRDRVIAF
jgi:predicted nucleotidyltransferase